MNRSIALVLLISILFSCSNENNETHSIQASRYGTALNHSMDSTLEDYYSLSELLVNWDSTRLNNAITGLQTSMQFLSSHMDTTTGNAKTSLEPGLVYFSNAREAADAMLQAHDLTQKRHVFHELSENIFHFLEAVQYDRSPVFLQECTMPFNDTGRGVWLSKNEDKRNPYLGLHHPYYKAGMLECGTLEGKIDFTSKQE